MDIHNLQEVMTRCPDMRDEHGRAMFRALGPFNDDHAWLGKYKGESPWTCHKHLGSEWVTRFGAMVGRTVQSKAPDPRTESG